MNYDTLVKYIFASKVYFDTCSVDDLSFENDDIDRDDQDKTVWKYDKYFACEMDTVWHTGDYNVDIMVFKSTKFDWEVTVYTENGRYIEDFSRLITKLEFKNKENFDTCLTAATLIEDDFLK